MDKRKIGFAVTGSFCTFKQAFDSAAALVAAGYDLTPIMSFNARRLDTRFGTAEGNAAILEGITGKRIISSIEDAEPIGPKKMFDLLIVAPCTSNTLAKLCTGVNDTPVTMAVKSHIRNRRPVVIAISTNDALASAAKNIGALQAMKNFYFVPYRQDDYVKKPFSMVADFLQLEKTAELAISGIQIQPMIAQKTV